MKHHISYFYNAPYNITHCIEHGVKHKVHQVQKKTYWQSQGMFRMSTSLNCSLNCFQCLHIIGTNTSM